MAILRAEAYLYKVVATAIALEEFAHVAAEVTSNSTKGRTPLGAGSAAALTSSSAYEYIPAEVLPVSIVPTIAMAVYGASRTLRQSGTRPAASRSDVLPFKNHEQVLMLLRRAYGGSGERHTPRSACAAQKDKHDLSTLMRNNGVVKQASRNENALTT